MRSKGKRKASGEKRRVLRRETLKSAGTGLLSRGTKDSSERGTVRKRGGSGQEQKRKNGARATNGEGETSPLRRDATTALDAEAHCLS